MKSIVFLGVIFLFVLSACSKNDKPVEPIQPEVPPTEAKINKIYSYQFVSIDSSDFHYYVGSPNGGVDRSKDTLLSSIFPLTTVLEYLEDSLSLDTSKITFYRKSSNLNFPYHLRNDTLFIVYRDDTPEGVPVGLLNKNDSSLYINRWAAVIYGSDMFGTGSSLSPSSRGFIRREDLFDSSNPYRFPSEKEMKNPKDYVSWVNLKFRYKLKTK